MSKEQTVVVNLKSRKHNDVFIGRPSLYGNPYKIGHDGTREEVIRKYAVYFINRIRHDRLFKMAVLKMRGKRLACYCAPLPCHGDVIAEYLNGIVLIWLVRR